MFKLKSIFLVSLFCLSNSHAMQDLSGKREQDLSRKKENEPKNSNLFPNFFIINWKEFDKYLIPPLFDKFKKTVNYENDIEKNKPELKKVIDFAYKKLIKDFENYCNYNGLYRSEIINLSEELLQQFVVFINVLKTNSETYELEKVFVEGNRETKIKYSEYKRLRVGQDAYNLMIKIKELYIDYGLLNEI
ncbi:hypothetical protein KJ644_04755 [Candidatus Dependentiae bacterium]|nr:hypothetical protein [Candidatus Dependentiae bacterium]MBU4387745.1 hypothetical protein [Candidatus Dependentiae bacterium]MCG2756337.1 hypothetical protein [Candidatus Dependentiae bacterium]